MIYPKPKIWFHSLGGGGPLSVRWCSGPYGDAVEDLNEKGVGFFAPNGELLAVEFDDVDAKSDYQLLDFDNRFKSRVEVTVKKGKVTVKLISRKPLRTKIA